MSCTAWVRFFSGGGGAAGERVIGWEAFWEDRGLHTPRKNPASHSASLIFVLSLSLPPSFFVGLLLRPQDMPRWLAWYKYLNFLHFSWAAQMLNQFGGGSGGDGSGGPLSLDGVNSVLAFYDIPVNGDPWVQLGYASLFFWFFAGVAWLALGFKTHQRR